MVIGLESAQYDTLRFVVPRDFFSDKILRGFLRHENVEVFFFKQRYFNTNSKNETRHKLFLFTRKRNVPKLN